MIVAGVPGLLSTYVQDKRKKSRAYLMDGPAVTYLSRGYRSRGRTERSSRRQRGGGQPRRRQQPLLYRLTEETPVSCCDTLTTRFSGAAHGDVPMSAVDAIYAGGPVGPMAKLDA